MMTRRKKITLSCIAVVVIALGIWVSKRWNAWFHDPPEMAYHIGDVPKRVVLTFGNHGENSRFVSWVCGERVDANARLLLVNNSDTLSLPALGEVFQSRAGKAAFYRCELKNLKPLSEYSYSVETNGNHSPWYHFKTSDPKAKSFSFMFVGDVQDSINGIVNKRLREAVRQHPEVEFIAFGGDLIERPTNSYYNEAFRSIDSICTALPVVVVTGNHDYLKSLIRKCERRFALTFPYFLKGMQEREDENHLFSFDYHDTQFLLLDSEREFFYLFNQREWLEEEIEESDASHRIVLLHHPLYSVRRKNNNLIQRWMFNNIIREGKTELVLQGHEHGYTRNTADEEPLKSVDCKNPPLYVISHCSPKTYRLHPSERHDPVIQGSMYYHIIDVTPHSIMMRAYDANSCKRIDSVRISDSFKQ